MSDQGKRVDELTDPIDGMFQVFSMKLAEAHAVKQSEDYSSTSHIEDVYKPGMAFKDFVDSLNKATFTNYAHMPGSCCMWAVRGVIGTPVKSGELTSMDKQYFQFWMKEYVDGLAEYIKNYNYNNVLEVGAGNGELSRLLRERGINIVATDNGSWYRSKMPNDVKRLKYQTAIEKYKPDLIICSWMPFQQDWTPDFRNSTAKEYLLIGEIGGCCADTESFDEKEGWIMTEGLDFDTYNVCKTDVLLLDSPDVPRYMTFQHSWTFSAKRI